MRALAAPERSDLNQLRIALTATPDGRRSSHDLPKVVMTPSSATTVLFLLHSLTQAVGSPAQIGAPAVGLFCL